MRALFSEKIISQNYLFDIFNSYIFDVESVNCLYVSYINTHVIKINALSSNYDKKEFERHNVLITDPILVGTCVTYK